MLLLHGAAQIKERVMQLTKVLFIKWIQGNQSERIIHVAGKAKEICKHSL